MTDRPRPAYAEIVRDVDWDLVADASKWVAAHAAELAVGTDAPEEHEDGVRTHLHDLLAALGMFDGEPSQ